MTIKMRRIASRYCLNLPATRFGSPISAEPPSPLLAQVFRPDRGPRPFGGKTPDRGALQITDLHAVGDRVIGILHGLRCLEACFRSKTGKRRYRASNERSLSGVFPS